MKSKSTARLRLPGTIVMLGVVSFFTDVSTEMMYPLIPVFVSLLGSGVVVLGVIEGVAEATASLLKLASGVLSDRLRRKKIFAVIGYAISSFIRPLTAVVARAWQIVVVRMLDRVGKGIRTSPRDALIAAHVHPSIRGRAFGFHRGMDHAGAVLGPVLAIVALWLLLYFSRVSSMLSALRWTFAFSLIPGGAAVGVLVLFVREKQSGGAQAAAHLSLRGLNRNFLRYVAVLFVFTLGNSSDAFLLFRVKEAIESSGLTSRLASRFRLAAFILNRFEDPQLRRQAMDVLILPFVWAFFHAVKVLVSTPLAALSDRVGRKTMICLGWGIYAVVYVGFSFLDRVEASVQLPMVFVLFAVYSLYFGATEGTEKAFVTDLVPAEHRGSAFGVYHALSGLGALPASILFGVVYSALGARGGRVAFLCGAGLAFTAMTLLIFLVREEARHAPEGEEIRR
jgi:MFS family permease